MDAWVVLWVVVGVVALPYVIGPFVVRAAMRLGRPVIEIVEPGQVAAVAEMEERMGEAARALERLGFAFSPLLSITGITPDVGAVALFARLERENIYAMIAAPYNVKLKKGLNSKYSVEFMSSFEGESALTTNNSEDRPFGPDAPEIVRLRFAGVKDPARLLDLHRAALRRWFAGKRAQRVVEPWWEHVLLESQEKFTARLVEAGWGTPQGEDVRLTLRGAAIGTYQNLPPLLQWRRRTTARERELLLASRR